MVAYLAGPMEQRRVDQRVDATVGQMAAMKVLSSAESWAGYWAAWLADYLGALKAESLAVTLAVLLVALMGDRWVVCWAGRTVDQTVGSSANWTIPAGMEKNTRTVKNGTIHMILN